MFTCISLLLVLGSCVSERLSGGWFERSINRLYRSRLQVEQHQRKGFLAGDATGLNGIRLHCINPFRWSLCLYEDYATVQSDAGSWGQWTDIKWCSGGFLTSFQLRVEQYQGDWDDTAANNIRFTCSGTGQVLEGSETHWGDVSNKCEGTGICGIRTMVELPGSGDETALNDVHMYCCD